MLAFTGVQKMEERTSTIESPTFAVQGTRFQEALAQLILDDSVFSAQIGEVLDVNFFELKYLRLFTQKIYDYRKKYSVHPSRETIGTILRAEINTESEVLQKQVREYYARIISTDNVDGAEHIKDVSLDFCKKQKLKEAMIKSVELIKSSSFDEVSKVINDALKLGTDNNHGYDYLADFESRFVLKARNPISTGWDYIDSITRGGLGRGELGVVIAPTGCHSRGTRVLMSDGAFKNVEDIVVGDKLLGPDSNNRNVLQLHRGTQMMYRVVPVKGDSFVVNAGHILSLRNTQNNKIVNISVSEYLSKNKNFKHLHKLYRSGAVSFQNSQKMNNAYFLGIMLGDGSVTSKQISFTTEDETLINEIKASGMIDDAFQIKSWAKANSSCRSYALNYSKNSKIFNFFNDLKLIGTNSGNKFIPHSYKTASISDRLELLAGLLDTDGSLNDKCFDYISKSKQLSEDVAFIARSVGLAAYVNECVKTCQNDFSGTYHRVSISGNCSIIPTRLNRKKAAARKQIKNVLNTGFAVIEEGEDDYYGFEVDGDNLYLMGDFTVTHNSGKSMCLVHIGAAALKAGKNVVYYTLELQDKVIGARFDSCLTGINLSEVINYKEQVLDMVKDLPGKLIIKEYPTKSASTNTIRSHLDKLKMHGHNVDMIIVDYADLLRPVTREKEKRVELESIYEELRGLAQMNNCTLWTASQTNRGGLNAEVVTMESISEAFNKCFVADFICTVSRTIKDKASNEGRMFIAKNRNGPDGMVYPIFMDTKNVKIKVLQESTESASEIIANSAKDQQKALKDKYRAFKKEQGST